LAGTISRMDYSHLFIEHNELLIYSDQSSATSEETAA